MFVETLKDASPVGISAGDVVLRFVSKPLLDALTEDQGPSGSIALLAAQRKTHHGYGRFDCTLLFVFALLDGRKLFHLLGVIHRRLKLVIKLPRILLPPDGKKVEPKLFSVLVLQGNIFI